jgi:hypothetical protein
MTVRPFISYAREDREIAMKLRDDLVRLGASPWIDIVNLRPGEEWQLAISTALSTCSHVLVLLSEHSVAKRGYVQREVRQAIDALDQFPPNSIFLIPVRLDQCEPAHERLKALQWVSLFDDYEIGLGQIAMSLGLEVGTPSSQVLTVAHLPSPLAHLSAKAVQLLVAAASGATGELHREALDQAIIVNANGQSFMALDGMEREELEGAVDELEDEQLIYDCLPPTRKLYQVTRKGHRLVDRLADKKPSQA